MSFLSRLLKGFSKPKSYIRDWAKKKENELGNRRANEITLDDWFASFIFGIANFGQDLTNDDIKHDKAAANKEYAKYPYAGDSSLFEIACYFYVEADLWLFENKPEIRDEASKYLFQQLCFLFMDALKMDNIPDLVHERVEIYFELVNNDSDAKDFHSLLTNLLRRTKYNTLPQRHGNGHPSINIDDLLGEIRLEMYVATFQANMLPALYETLESFFKYAQFQQFTVKQWNEQ